MAKRLKTKLTFEGLISSMDMDMSLQVRTSIKLLGTQLTFNGLLSSMGTEMTLQERTVIKLPGTQFTFKGLLSSMEEAMSLQFTRGGEVLVAECTLQGKRVETAMLAQSTPGLADLAAIPTLDSTRGCFLGETHRGHGSCCLHGDKDLF